MTSKFDSPGPVSLAHTKYECRWRLPKFLEAYRQGAKPPGAKRLVGGGGGGGDWTCGETHEPKRLGGEMDLWRDIPDSPRITRTFSGCYFFFSINAAKSEIIKMSRISHQMSPNENSKLVLT